ncbi:RHS repeat-associated core domain-containing protein [Sorangium sp. So ce1099]|uniref:RHS repeat-associated core domain-containing protein n=1 Tax=Sorangium sp. So ce1099 TaxID=3133331 RepID=UPI003F62BF0C
MSQAAKFFDPVLGIDIHLVVVPPSPAPVPLPHPFIGIVFDPIGFLVGAAIGAVFGGGGPVLVNGMPVGNTGTECIAIPHFPMPPGVSFHPTDVPDNEGTIITGAKTVTMGGPSEGRFGSMVASCNFPINLPTSLCLAIPLGAPVDVGGPEAVDWFAAVTRGIRTKWFSGALNRMLKAAPGSRLSKIICFLTGHPVDVMTGEVLTDAVDFELPGPLPLVFERNYYSRDQYCGSLGQGWHHPLDAHVVEDGVEVRVRLADGRERVHGCLLPGQSVWDDLDRYTLARFDDGYRLTTWDGIAHEFRAISGGAPHGDVSGRAFLLVRMSDRCDNAIQLYYEKGLLRQVLDSGGRRLEVEHTRDGRLSRISCDGVALARYAYDGSCLISVTDPLGHAVRYSYRGGVLVREINKNGLSFYFEYDWEHPEGWCIRTWGDGGIYDRRITYDKARHTTLVDDGRGGRTHYFGNAAGLVEREIDPTGVEKRHEWDQHCRKVAEVDGLGHRTEWAYDERGNTILERNVLGEETRRSFNSFSLPEAVVDAAGSRWTIGYDNRGEPVTITDPLGHACRYHHDRRGRLRKSENALGQVFELLYDDRGNLAETKDREGGRACYAWDGFGRLVAYTDPLGRRTAFSWDACGRLVEVRFPDGGVERRAYDPEGNLVDRTDTLGNTTRYRYAGFNKLVEQIDPEGHSVCYHYDVEENLIGLTNELGETYRIDVDLAGRVVREVGFDGRTLVFRYDRAGRCVEVMNGQQKITRLERDALGRITRQLLPGRSTLERPLPPPEEVLFVYDARGDLVRARNGDADVHFERDALGRVVVERVGEMAIESRYDAAGRRVLRRTSAGHVTGYDIDGNGLLRGLAVLPDEAWLGFDQVALHAGVRPERAPWSMRLTRDAAGAEIERKLPDCVVQRWEHDVSGRPAVQEVALMAVPVLRREYTWRSDEQIATIADQHRGVTRYDYDRRSYLVAAHRPDGTTQYRTPDPASNLYRTPDRSDRVYGRGGMLKQAEGATYVHDADGNMTEKVLPDGRTWTYHWDGAGQLREVVRPDRKVVSFAYDALGRRVRKTSDGQKNEYVWDGNDVVHEVRPDSGITTWEFEPGTFTPVVKIEGNRRYGIITDHLGTPLAMLDESGSIAWESKLDIHGAACTDAMHAPCPWRWPGQYEDEETGLHYNRFRYYDPSIARYISQDPIRIRGGINLFEYVTNPITHKDPLGLADCVDSRTIRFSQNSIKSILSDTGDSIFDIAKALKKGTISADSIPAIRITVKEGITYTLDNRRLAIFRLAKMPIRVIQATADEAALEAWKFTTKNKGVSIFVRDTGETII